MLRSLKAAYDTIARISVAIVDFKPESVGPTTGAQLAGYALLADEGASTVPRRISLHFDKKGRVKTREHLEHRVDRNGFLSALSAHNYGVMKGQWK